MICKYCGSNSVKNGFDRRSNQRYKCRKCKKTFIILPDESSIKKQNIRMLLHLIIEGFEVPFLSKCTGIPEKIIKRYRGLYLKGWQYIVHPKRKKKSILNVFLRHVGTEEEPYPGEFFSYQPTRRRAYKRKIKYIRPETTYEKIREMFDRFAKY